MAGKTAYHHTHGKILAPRRMGADEIADSNNYPATPQKEDNPPKQLITLPWDRKAPKRQIDMLSGEERRKRFEELKTKI